MCNQTDFIKLIKSGYFAWIAYNSIFQFAKFILVCRKMLSWRSRQATQLNGQIFRNAGNFAKD